MSDVGIYIHIPFCQHRCTYCDFNIYAGMRSLYERYARAVAKEIASHSPSPLTHLPPSGGLPTDSRVGRGGGDGGGGEV